jgi:hypothetical protein
MHAQRRVKLLRGMGRATHILVPCRFLAATWYFVAVVMALYSVDANVGAGRARGAPAGVGAAWASAGAGDAGAAAASCTAALVVSALLLAGNQASLLCGYTLMLDQLSFVHAACGLAGGALMTAYVLEAWRWQAAWWLCALCAAPPALAEAVSLLALTRFNW